MKAALRALFGLVLVTGVAALPGSSHADPIHGAGPGIYGEGKGAATPDSATGAMRYDFPFHLPSARGSVQPALGLTYSSAAHDGEAGYGWTLSLPTIERRPASGWPKFYAEDGSPVGDERYTFEGQLLALVCANALSCSETPNETHPSWSGGWAHYRLQVDDLQARFYLSPNRATWRVQLKGGEHIELGEPTNGVLPGSCDAIDRDPIHPQAFLRWRVTRRFDPARPFMSVVEYCWKKLGTRGLSFLTDMWDTPRPGSPTNLSVYAHHTQLDWEAHDFPSASYAFADRARPDQRLHRVSVASATWLANGEREIVRTYELAYLGQRASSVTYDPTTETPFWNHSFLQKITERASCGSESDGAAPANPACAASTPAVRFEYAGTPVTAFGVQTPFNGVPPEIAQPLPWVLSVSIVDFNRDGLPDLVQSWQHRGPCQCPDAPAYYDIYVANPGVEEPALRCKSPSGQTECNLRSAKPILGYVNRGGSGTSFDYTCMDAGDMVAKNGGFAPGFLTPAGNNVLGAFSESQLLWRLPRPLSSPGLPATPIMARPVVQTGPPGSGGCDLGGNFNPTEFHPRWRWVAAGGDWAKPAVAIAEPLAPRIYADVDGDGYPDEIGQSGEDISSDLRRTSVDYTRMYSRFDPEHSDTRLVPFDEYSATWESVAPKPTPSEAPLLERTPHFFYTDVNGDGLADLVVHHPVDPGPVGIPTQTQVVRVYPGNGRGRFACDAAAQPSWPCQAGVTTDPAHQPYALAIGGPLPPFGSDVFFHDVTGDGLADIVAFQGEWGAGNVRLWINRDGHAFECAGGNPQCSVGSIVGTQGLPRRISFADMNADGVDDLVLITPGTTWVASFSSLLAGIGPARGTKPGQLVKIHNGVGATTEIHYETVQALDVAAAADPDTAWRHHSPAAQSVVTEVRVRDTKAATSGVAEAAPYAIDRVTRYYYRDPAYDRWKRSLVGFRKIAAREGNELAVTESTRWYGQCENANVPAVGGPGAELLCGESSDEETSAGSHKSWLVGKVVGIDRYVPRWIAGGEVVAGRFEWAKRFHYEPGGVRFNGGANSVGRRVVHTNLLRTTTTHYDTAVDASLPPPEWPAPDADDETPALPTQAGSKTVARAFAYGHHDNLKREAYCGAPGEVLDATETVLGNVRGLVTTYRDTEGGTEPTCDAEWRCGARDVHVWRIHGAPAPCENVVDADLTQNTTTLRHTRLTLDASKEVVKVEAKLLQSNTLDRRHAAAGAAFAADAPGQATAGAGGDWKTQSDIVRDPDTGMPTQLWGAGSATSSERSCTSVAYDPSYGHLPMQVSRHLLGCDQAIGAQTTSFVFDRGLQVVTTSEAPNGGVTMLGIDAFGRTTAVWQPRSDYAGQSQAAQIIYHDQAPSRPLTAVEVRTYTEHGGIGLVRTVQVSNGLGEPVLDFSPGDQGDWIVSGFATRTASGAVADATRPWGGVTADPVAVAANATPVTAGLPPAHFQWFHDFFGRVQEVHEDGITVGKHTFLPLALRTQDAEQSKPGGRHSGNYSEVRFDGRGQARLSLLNASANAEPEVSTKVERDGAGHPVRVVRCAGDCDAPGATEVYERKLEYDSLGRLTKNLEPNTAKEVEGSLRHWRYAFDDANRMVGTSDARGCGVNLYYDAFGRIQGEDYSPCLATQPVYTPPNPATGDGFEVWNRYDGYENGQVQSDLTFEDDPAFAIGNLTVVKDRGSHTRFAYDVLGRTRRTDRRIVKPASFAPQVGDAYAAHFFSKRMDFDLADRLRRATTGADGDLLGAGGDSEEIHSYSPRGFLTNVNSTYGEIIASTKYAVDGQVEEVTYGDFAATKATLLYDTRRQLREYAIARPPPGAGSGWVPPHATYPAPPPSTTQAGLANVEITRDDLGNPTRFKDTSAAAQWPDGAKPRLQQDIAYDAHYRVTSVGTQYAGGPDMQVHPFETDVLQGDTRPAPLADVSTRIAQQDFQYDLLGNTSFTNDDAAKRFDRSLGAVYNGIGEGPNQLRGADGVTARYDEAGNLVELKVERPGTCVTATSSMCHQWYHYDWDEVGQLARARRWDYATELPVLQAGEDYPADTPAWDLQYAYSLGVRVLKSAKDAAGVERHTVEIFDSLRLQQVPFRESTEEYRREGHHSHAYLAGGVAHVLYDRFEALPQANPNTLVHTFLSFGDHLGSTSFVIDKDSSELVERAEHQPYGAIESDYRSRRWDNPREDYKFTGKEEDIEVGLTYFGARYYHARLGRWASADPLTIHGLGADPNPYAYVRGRVTSAVDPFGLDCVMAESTNGRAHVVQSGPCGTGGAGSGTAGEQRASVLSMHYPSQAQRDQQLASFVQAQTVSVSKDAFDRLPGPRPPQPRTDGPFDPKQVVPGIFATVGDYYEPPDALGILVLKPMLRHYRPATSNNPGFQTGQFLAGAVLVAAPEILADKAVIGGVARLRNSVAKAILPRAYSVAFETTLHEGLRVASRGTHFAEANGALYEAMQASPELAASMDKLGIQMAPGPNGAFPRTPPAGWTWHHEAEPGVMRLVPREQHTIGSPWWSVLHPGGKGGYAIWGQ